MAETIFADVADLTVRVSLPPAAAAPMLPLAGHDAFGELAVKLILNAASTGAQVSTGAPQEPRGPSHSAANPTFLHAAEL